MMQGLIQNPVRRGPRQSGLCTMTETLNISLHHCHGLWPTSDFDCRGEGQFHESSGSAELTAYWLRCGPLSALEILVHLGSHLLHPHYSHLTQKHGRVQASHPSTKGK